MLDNGSLTRPVSGHKLPQRARLSGQLLIRGIITRGRRCSDGRLTVYMAPNRYNYARMGVSVGRACGKAVVRNRLKRLVREAFRLERAQIPPGFDYMVILSPRWAKAGPAPTLAQVRVSLTRLILRAFQRETGSRQ